MSEKNTAIVVFVTINDAAEARKISGKLLEEKLVACINMISGISSMYYWEGAIQSDNEILLMMKTNSSQLANLKERVINLHPYDVPEFIALKVEDGSQDYLQWINDTIHPSDTKL